MKWLTIDTSTAVLGIGIMDEETVWAEMTTHLKRHHSERLLPSIQHLLQETNIPLNDIGGVAVTRGPGSYTGVRIGVTTAKVLAWALNIPLVGVSSLAALAVNGERFPGCIIPMWDARRERVYTGRYRFDELGELIQLDNDRVTHVTRWVEALANEEGSFLFLGDGAVSYRKLIESELKGRAIFSSMMHGTVRPTAIARLAWRSYHKEGPDEILTFAPEYLQVTEAEANWEMRNRTEDEKS